MGVNFQIVDELLASTDVSACGSKTLGEGAHHDVNVPDVLIEVFNDTSACCW